MSEENISILDMYIFNANELYKSLSYLRDIGYSMSENRILFHENIEISFDNNSFICIEGYVKSNYNQMGIRFYCTSFDDFRRFYEESFCFLSAKSISTRKYMSFNFLYRNGKFSSYLSKHGNLQFTVISNNEVKYFLIDGKEEDETRDLIPKLPNEYEPKYVQSLLPESIEKTEDFVLKYRKNNVL